MDLPTLKRLTPDHVSHAPIERDVHTAYRYERHLIDVVSTFATPGDYILYTVFKRAARITHRGIAVIDHLSTDEWRLVKNDFPYRFDQLTHYVLWGALPARAHVDHDVIDDALRTSFPDQDVWWFRNAPANQSVNLFHVHVVAGPSPRVSFSEGFFDAPRHSA